jgi:hypothetical protein
MISQQLMEKVLWDVQQHVRKSKGYEQGPWVNPLVTADSVYAFAMAHLLVERKVFDYCVAVAPEGHAYGYFFERLGASVLAVHVDYPPRACAALDDLAPLRGQRVLIVEDDVVSGLTLRLVVSALRRYKPRSLDLFLGRPKADQLLENVPPEIGTVYVAEDTLDPRLRGVYELSFAAFFSIANAHAPNLHV